MSPMRGDLPLETEQNCVPRSLPLYWVADLIARPVTWVVGLKDAGTDEKTVKSGTVPSMD